MTEIASETDCAANHPDYYWPPAESVEAYKNLIFNCVIFQYDDGYFMAASADAKGIYADGKSSEEALEDLRTAIECRVFDKQGGIHSGTSKEEFQNDYFHDLETDCEKDVVKIVNKYQCTVTVFSHLQNFLDSLAINTISNEDEITAYYAYLRTIKSKKLLP